MRTLLYSELSAKWIHYYIEICEKILHNMCLCLWYTAMVCIWAIVYYICIVCVSEIRDLHGLGYAKTTFAKVPSYIDRLRHDRLIGSRILLSIDQFDYCLHFVSVSSVKWYWDYNRNVCSLYHYILCTIVCILCLLCGVCVYVYILLYTAACSSQRNKRK